MTSSIEIQTLPVSLDEVLATIVRAAHDAERVIHDGAQRRSSLHWESKGPADYLTEVDTGAEAAIRRTLLADYPAAHVLGEESWDGEVIGAGLWFVADPLDGTTNFLHGIQEYAVSIAALYDGELIAGVVLNAARGDLFTATRGGGAYLDGVQLHVSSVSEPPRALIATGFPFNNNANLNRYVRQFSNVARATAGVRRAGAAALDFANVAAGRYDAFWENRLSPWDFAAGMLLVREAGGIVTDFDNAPAQVRHGSVIAGNPAMHAWLLEQIRDADRNSTSGHTSHTIS